jgi:asparagine synthase (glutamine-hydrolysing)
VNGEIYNHKKLKVLIDAQTPSDSDSEVVGFLYKKFGVEMPALLDGMFAFVLFDHEASTVFAARDHMGICPMYIAYGHDGSVWFASEMKCFVNEPRIARYEIFPPGHYYHGGPGTPNGFVRWYSPNWMDIDVQPTKPADLALIRDTLVESVVKRLMADVPYGVLLSGGLDSSLVTSIAVSQHAAAYACAADGC